MGYLPFPQARGGVLQQGHVERGLGNAQQGYRTHSGNVKTVMWGKVVVFVRAKCLPETRYGSQKEGLMERVPERAGRPAWV